MASTGSSEQKVLSVTVRSCGPTRAISEAGGGACLGPATHHEQISTSSCISVGLRQDRSEIVSFRWNPDRKTAASNSLATDL